MTYPIIRISGLPKFIGEFGSMSFQDYVKLKDILKDMSKNKILVVNINTRNYDDYNTVNIGDKTLGILTNIREMINTSDLDNYLIGDIEPIAANNSAKQIYDSYKDNGVDVQKAFRLAPRGHGEITRIIKNPFIKFLYFFFGGFKFTEPFFERFRIKMITNFNILGFDLVPTDRKITSDSIPVI